MMGLAIKYATVHERIAEHEPGVGATDVWIDRHTVLGPYVGYYPTLVDAQEDNRTILDVWDRASWREAYRHARIWGHYGIGQRTPQAGRSQ